MSKYQITKEQMGTFTKVLLKNTDTGEYIAVIPNTGGAVNEMVIKGSDGLTPILDSYASDTEFKETLYSSFKGSNLFPFPNRVNKGKYSFEGVDYQLNINSPTEPHAIHGLVYNQQFEIVKESADNHHAYLQLQFEYKGDKQGYPFAYKLKTEYIMHEKTGFTCKTTVRNTGEKLMPYGSGWHPYFMAGGSINEVSLQFQGKYFYPVNDIMIPTGEKHDYNAFNTLKPVNDTAFDSCFEIQQDKELAEIMVKNEATGLAYKVWCETGEGKYNFLQIYIPPARKTIALEPMTCAPDAFNNGLGRLTVNPGEEKSFSWGVK